VITATASHHDEQAIANAAALFIQPGQVAEVRALDVTLVGDRYVHNTASGYFDDPVKLAAAVVGTIQQAGAVYITLNPVDVALLARACNRIKAVKKQPTTSDADIVRRQWLLVDVDPVRASGISSSDDEHDAALAAANQIADSLAADGWPSPVVMDSGNGAALLYRVNLTANDGGLVELCIKALAQRFDTSQISIDESVFNPARITRLAGTRNCKGDSTPDRPHRMAAVLELPDPLVTVPVDLLESLAGTAPKPAPVPPKNRLNGNVFDIDAWILRHGLRVDGPHQWKDGRRWILPVCPWNHTHTNRSAFIIQQASGAICAGCHHNGCQGFGWKDLREVYEPGHAERRNGHTTAPGTNGTGHQRHRAPTATAIPATPGPTGSHRRTNPTSSTTTTSRPATSQRVHPASRLSAWAT
jgi:hypothetical protein